MGARRPQEQEPEQGGVDMDRAGPALPSSLPALGLLRLGLTHCVGADRSAPRRPSARAGPRRAGAASATNADAALLDRPGRRDRRRLSGLPGLAPRPGGRHAAPAGICFGKKTKRC